MKKLLFLFTIILVVVLGCQKEDNLKPKIEYAHSYSITDDPTDPVQHRRYQIYQKYDVPVYFNDTIDMVYMGLDVKGEPIYRYEMLDLGWSFSSHTYFTYFYEYMTDPERQQEALDLVEKYLELASPALHPFSFFIFESAIVENTSGGTTQIGDADYSIEYRTIMMTWNWEEEDLEELPVIMMRDMVSTKISNYSEELLLFNKVSDQAWYGSLNWKALEPSLSDWWSCSILQNPEQNEELAKQARAVVGKFGFISGSNSGMLHFGTPYDTDDDLQSYIREMLKYSPEEFNKQWGDYPLVMEKYNILYEIITEKLGVEL